MSKLFKSALSLYCWANRNKEKDDICTVYTKSGGNEETAEAFDREQNSDSQSNTLDTDLETDFSESSTSIKENDIYKSPSTSDVDDSSTSIKENEIYEAPLASNLKKSSTSFRKNDIYEAPLTSEFSKSSTSTRKNDIYEAPSTSNFNGSDTDYRVSCNGNDEKSNKFLKYYHVSHNSDEDCQDSSSSDEKYDILDVSDSKVNLNEESINNYEKISNPVSTYSVSEPDCLNVWYTFDKNKSSLGYTQTSSREIDLSDLFDASPNSEYCEALKIFVQPLDMSLYTIKEVDDESTISRQK